MLLNKLEWTVLESPVVVSLVSDEDPDWITLLKNPRCFVGSLVHPTALDGLMCGFSGPDSQRLATAHIPASTFEISAAFNALDDAAMVCLGLENLPADQEAFHPYVNVSLCVAGKRLSLWCCTQGILQHHPGSSASCGWAALCECADLVEACCHACHGSWGLGTLRSPSLYCAGPLPSSACKL